MVSLEVIKQLETTPLTDHLEIIEILFRSLKNDIKTVVKKAKPFKQFKVRTFGLGQEIHIDRDELYTERS